MLKNKLTVVFIAIIIALQGKGQSAKLDAIIDSIKIASCRKDVW